MIKLEEAHENEIKRLLMIGWEAFTKNSGNKKHLAKRKVYNDCIECQLWRTGGEIREIKKVSF